MGSKFDSFSDDDDDDDDIYVGSVARLRELKKQAPTCNDVIVIDDNDDVEENDVDCSVVVNNKTCADDSLLFKSGIDSLNCTETEIDENYIVDVKVNWRSQGIIRFEVKKYESLEKVFEHFAKMESVPVNQILILKGDKPILKTNTPGSINLGVIDILEGGIVDAANCKVTIDENIDENDICKIKVQTSTKQKIMVNLKTEETFEKVISACAKELDVDPSRIKLSFDGDEVTPTDTPQSLDLDQEACIDLRILS